MERFFCPNLEVGLLNEAESHHCLQVFRNKIGDSILVFDGQGREWKASILSIRGRLVHFAQLHETRSAPPSPRLVLAPAILKGKAMDLLLQKATELGVSEVIPLLTQRTVVRVGEDRAEDKTEKWRETLIEATKQSGGTWLPKLAAPQSIEDFLGKPRTGAARLLASLGPSARPLKQTIQELRRQPEVPREWLIIIGPEGDLTPAETSIAESAGYWPVSLGPSVLRAETASLYALSILRYECEVSA